MLRGIYSELAHKILAISRLNLGELSLQNLGNYLKNLKKIWAWEFLSIHKS